MHAAVRQGVPKIGYSPGAAILQFAAKTGVNELRAPELAASSAFQLSIYPVRCVSNDLQYHIGRQQDRMIIDHMFDLFKPALILHLESCREG